MDGTELAAGNEKRELVIEFTISISILGGASSVEQLSSIVHCLSPALPGEQLRQLLYKGRPPDNRSTVSQREYQMHTHAVSRFSLTIVREITA